MTINNFPWTPIYVIVMVPDTALGEEIDLEVRALGSSAGMCAGHALIALLPEVRGRISAIINLAAKYFGNLIMTFPLEGKQSRS